MEKEYERLKENVILQARYFLENADEFYPFGAAIDKNYELKPIGIYFGEEYPSCVDVFNRLENALKDGIKKNHYLLAAIGMDVYITVDKKKQTALEIIVYNEDTVKKYHYIYSKSGDKYIFQQHLST
jgi:hypothetical protein